MKQLQQLYIVLTWNEIPWLHKRVGHLSRPFLVGQRVWGTNSDRDGFCHREPAPSACGFSPTHMKQLQQLYIVLTWNEIPWLHERVGHLSRPFLVGQRVWEPDKGEQWAGQKRSWY